MEGEAKILAAFLPVLAAMGVGFLLRWRRVLTHEADASLLKLTLQLLIPCLIFDYIVGNERLRDWRVVWGPPLLAYATIVGGMALAWAVAPWAGLRAPAQRRSFSVAVGFYNWAYLALPVVEYLFDRQTVGMLLVFNLGVELAVWTAGVMTLQGGWSRRGWRGVANPAVASLVGAVIVNALCRREELPELVTRLVHLLAGAAIPVGLLLVGAVFYDHLREAAPHRQWPVGVWAAVLRLGILPAVMVAAAVWLPLETELRRVLVVQAAMPAAVFPVILSKHYGGDAGTALRVVLWTTAGALVTAPLWLGAGLRWIGE